MRSTARAACLWAGSAGRQATMAERPRPQPVLAAPGRDADRDRAGADLDAQLLASRARAAVELVADLLIEPDAELLSLRDLDEGGNGGLAASEPGERPGPLDRVPGRHHSQLEPPVVRARLGESLDPAEYLADVRGQHARDRALVE